MDLSTCERTGQKCKKNGDCKEKQLCLQQKGEEGRRCHKVPFNCRSDSECEEGRYCVRSEEFRHLHTCERRPKRCNDHKECRPTEECVETLIRGFNGQEWSSRCLAVPFHRCVEEGD
jgi:hypothetical protein